MRPRLITFVKPLGVFRKPEHLTKKVKTKTSKSAIVLVLIFIYMFYGILFPRDYNLIENYKKKRIECVEKYGTIKLCQ